MVQLPQNSKEGGISRPYEEKGIRELHGPSQPGARGEKGKGNSKAHPLLEAGNSKVQGRNSRASK